jgi:hypothetical protein
MLKLIHSPLTRVTISGFLIFAAIVDSTTISFSQNAKKSINHISSDLINTQKTAIARKSFRDKFMNEALKIILADSNHPLACLVDYKQGKWKKRVEDGRRDKESDGEEPPLDDDHIGVQAGHSESGWSLDSDKPETVALQDATDNHIQGRDESRGVIFVHRVIEIGGVPVIEASAKKWAKDETCPSLKKENVQSAKIHLGYRGYTRPDARRKRSSEPTTPSSLHRESSSQNEVPLFAKPGTSTEVNSPKGVLPELLSSSGGSEFAKSAPGGIDFSTLELNYIAEDLGLFADRGLKYAFNGVPTAGNKNLKAGRVAAAQASDAFFVWLSLSPDKFWVNLNPNEPDRIIDSQFGTTDAGRILLQADLRMKKTVAQLIHPDTSLGKQFWEQLDWRNSQACVSFRQWIVPAPATVREDGDGIYIADAPLNVKLESQYLQSKGIPDVLASCATVDRGTLVRNESIFRKLILPRVEQAVNKAPEYADLRRVYRSRVAAEWYRQRSASKATAYREMVNHNDVSSWPARQDWSSREVFNQYVDSYKKGEFRVTHKWQEGNMIYTYLYVFGGVDFTKVLFNKLSSTDFQKKWGNLQQVVDKSMKSPVADQNGKIWLGGTTITGRAIWKSLWLYVGLGTLGMLFLTYGTRLYKKVRS